MNGELIFTICYGGLAFLVGAYAHWALGKEYKTYESNNK